MKKLLLFAAALAFVTSAQAQQARVVTACGSMAPFGANTAGTTAYTTINLNGQLCVSSGTLLTDLSAKLDELNGRLKALEERK